MRLISQAAPLGSRCAFPRRYLEVTESHLGVKVKRERAPWLGDGVSRVHVAQEELFLWVSGARAGPWRGHVYRAREEEPCTASDSHPGLTVRVCGKGRRPTQGPSQGGPEAEVLLQGSGRGVEGGDLCGLWPGLPAAPRAHSHSGGSLPHLLPHRRGRSGLETAVTSQSEGAGRQGWTPASPPSQVFPWEPQAEPGAFG